MADEFAIETQHLSKNFGSLAAVNDVSIKIKKNSLHAIIGPNGAGKPRCSISLAGL